MTKFLFFILMAVLLVWGIQALYIVNQNKNLPREIATKAKLERTHIVSNYKTKEQQLINEYERKKYQATGNTVYDRIFNKPTDTLTGLIENIAKESVPNSWKIEVEIEEFTHYILLVYLPSDTYNVSVDAIAKYLHPIISYCAPCLTDVAVFDRTHKSYLFFDKNTLNQLNKSPYLTNELTDKIKAQGESFIRFNSVILQCEKHLSHLFLPVEVSGSGGIVSCYMLFDTGASTTTISQEVAKQTGYDNLVIAPKRSFNTANGWMSCPLIKRNINIGSFHKNIEVAVNENDDLTLLGMNFFDGMDYIVDFTNSCIYVWEKSSIKK